MTPLLECALANVVLAVPLAVLAAVGSLSRRPAVAHALWLLVLVRLLAPPLWKVPLPEWRSEKPAAPLTEPQPTRAEFAARTDVPAIERPVIAESPVIRAQPAPVAPEPIAVAAILGAFWLLGTV